MAVSRLFPREFICYIIRSKLLPSIARSRLAIKIFHQLKPPIWSLSCAGQAIADMNRARQGFEVAVFQRLVMVL